MASVLDCEIVVSEFGLQLNYYIYFRIDTIEDSMNPFIPPAVGKIVSLLFFHKDLTALNNQFIIKFNH